MLILKIIITHNLAYLSNEQRVIVIDEGVKVADGTLEEVKKNPDIASMQLFDASAGSGQSDGASVEASSTCEWS